MICGRWLETIGKPVEHSLGMVHVKEVDSRSITEVLQFLHTKSIDLKRLRGLEFDGASTMSGCRSGVQMRMKCHAPSFLYIHCHCHRLQLAAVNDHREVSKVFGTLLTM